LEALYKLQNSLKVSVDSLLDAKERLGGQIKEVSVIILGFEAVLRLVTHIEYW
jgi:hypothetical protein